MALRLIILIFCATCSIAGCSSGRGDPLAPGGAMTPGVDRANLEVSDDSKYLACQQIFEQIHGSYIKAASVAQYLTQPESSARIIGQFNGNATIRATNHDSAGGGWRVFPNLAITYNHFSETGELYLNGPLAVNGSWSTDGGKTTPLSIILDGTADFSGDYKGSITFDGFQLGLESDGKLVDLPARVLLGPTYSLPLDGLVTIISGQTTIEFDPHLFDWQ